MIKPAWLLIVFFISSMTIIAQQKPLPINEEIEKALTSIKEFNKSESRMDSVAGHPLGSNKEEDFLRRYNFYDTVSAKLNGIDKGKLGFDDQINLELLKYSINDELSSYKFKAYLNPILAMRASIPVWPLWVRKYCRPKKSLIITLSD